MKSGNKQEEKKEGGNSSKPVSGKKGGNVTLTCEHEANSIDHIKLFSRSENIDVCQTEECSGRVFKEGNCDVVIKNLSFSDAGKYFLRIYYNNDQTELTYQLHIHDEISLKIGKPLKMSVLLSNADKVETNSSGEWKEVWSRTDGVQSDRMNDTDENLIIKVFLDRDAGTYRVLDSEGEILITVTITASSTESGTESPGKLDDTDKDKTNDTEQHKNWIVSVVVCLVILAVIVISVIIWRRQHRDHTQVPAEENPEPPQELQEL
ncbi:hypothetical protein cypCar_00046117 [Cyprinus carpio]|nr:hypothetical protein cypCar_00046117 [Cyprinus carpio]